MKTLVTIGATNDKIHVARPFFIKILPASQRYTTVSWHATEEEAINALEQMEKAEPGIYSRVSEYRMQKEQSSF